MQPPNVIGELVSAADPKTRGLVILMLTGTLALAALMTLGYAFFAAAEGITVPSWIPLVVTFVLGTGSASLGSHAGSANAAAGMNSILDAMGRAAPPPAPQVPVPDREAVR